MSCVLVIKPTSEFLLYCSISNDDKHTLLTLFTLNNTDCNILQPINSILTETVLFSTSLFDMETNALTVNAAIDNIQEPIIYSH